MKKADIILKSSAVFTGLSAIPQKGAVIINGNRITAFVSWDDTETYIGPQTVLKDYGDCMILPGFCEAHAHFQDGALFGSEDFLREIAESKSEEECVQMVQAFAESHPALEKIVGLGWFPANWNDAPLPTRHSLDAVCPDRPILLHAADGHSAWLNTKAIELTGVDKNQDPDLDKFILKEENGYPAGVVKEKALFDYVTPHIYQMGFVIDYKVQRNLIRGCNACGITSFNDLSGHLPHVEYDAREAMEQRGELTIRMHLSGNLDGPEKLEEAKALRKRFSSPFLSVPCVKGMLDGTTSTYTASLFEPYTDNPGVSGDTLYQYEALIENIKAANAAGFGVRIHCIGDKAVRWALDGYEASARVNDLSNIRNAVEHIETIHPDDIPRFKLLNTVASMQPAHVPLEYNEKLSRVGYERCVYEWPFRSILETGGILAFGTDYFVSDYNPLPSIYYAVTRHGYDGKITSINPWEKIDLYEALRAYTLGGAYAEGRDHELGTLSAGKLADIAVIDRNLFDIDVEEIKDAKVVMTMLDGKIIYEK